ncbi:hypothetical protein BDV96DRAFT_607914 [Lophiotrema nucula]|uniref:Phosphatidylethanolamine-binding protein n=1 Tax=Lophiotrema nucula TaxID=690887 RepID=A0A6A5YGH1_9PLEO|nr:hypothetical protein BDV96DRAFT_607914 [Lophiotrema nucula]
MQLSNLLATACTLLPFTSSTPSVQPTPPPTPPGPKYFLKVNAPHEPWHGRHIVQLPTSGRLGPPSQPGSSDSSRIPLVAALTSNLWTGDKAASLRVLEGNSPEDVNDDCPDVARCKADDWNVNFDGSDRPTPLTFGGFPGVFAAVKDASPEGWHVYWESTEGQKHKKKPKHGTEIGLEVYFYGASSRPSAKDNTQTEMCQFP